MFTVEYVEGADELLDIIKSSPSDIFNAPYTGYLLFLFGETDSETADWIRYNLRSLDSLTGTDIAGAVFAKSFEFKGLVTRRYSTHPGHLIKNSGVALSHVHKSDDSNFTHRASEVFERGKLDGPGVSLENLTATTYASDEIAKSLGLTARLPCIVFLDALPSSHVALDLNEQNIGEAFSIIREILGKYFASENYAVRKSSLIKSFELGNEVLLQKTRLSSISSRETIERGHIKQPIVRILSLAKNALLDSSAKKFCNILNDKIKEREGKPLLPSATVNNALLRAKENARRLNHIGRTIRSVSFYVEIRNEPLGPQDKERLCKIYAKHVEALLNDVSPAKFSYTIEFLSETLDKLRGLFSEVIEEIWGDLPHLDTLIENQKKAVADSKAKFDRESEEIKRTLRAASENLVSNLNLISDGPNLTNYAEEVINNRVPNVNLSPLGDNAMLKSVLDAISSGTLKISGGDVYIANNVAAMGPSASASNIRFVGKSD